MLVERIENKLAKWSDFSFFQKVGIKRRETAYWTSKEGKNGLLGVRCWGLYLKPPVGHKFTITTNFYLNFREKSK